MRIEGRVAGPLTDNGSDRLSIFVSFAPAIAKVVSRIVTLTGSASMTGAPFCLWISPFTSRSIVPPRTGAAPLVLSCENTLSTGSLAIASAKPPPDDSLLGPDSETFIELSADTISTEGATSSSHGLDDQLVSRRSTVPPGALVEGTPRISMFLIHTAG